KSAKSGDQGNNKEELIALYEKKKCDAETPSHVMVSVLLTEQLQRVKEVLATWKEVDERVSKLCPSENADHDSSTAAACSTGKITDGLVGFLSGNLSDGTWKDEYLGVNATVNKGEVTSTDNGVSFTGRGAGAEWPVGKQGENQLYHFANYNFTLVATVSFDEAPKEGSIPLIGAKMNDNENTVLVGLSYNNEKNWILLCGDATTNSGEQSRVSEPEKAQHVVILLRNGNQGSAYVDGQPVGGNEQCKLETTDSKEISHFYIGGATDDADSREGVSVTVTNVLLYNRPLDDNEITALNKKKPSISRLGDGNKLAKVIPSAEVIAPASQGTVSQPTPGELQQTAPELLKTSKGTGGGDVSTSTLSTVTNSPAGKESVKNLASGTSPDGHQNVDGGSTADGYQTTTTGYGDNTQEDGP
ncbi:trans-sialidase, putative, partial [Trypanosoma cruzi]